MSGIKGISISGYSQSNVSISTSEATATITTPGDYSFWSDVDCYIKIAGANASAVTTSNGWVLFANSMPPPIYIGANEVIRIITVSGTGTFRYHPIGIMR